MRNSTTFRLYRFVDAPFQLMGLTIPQIGLFFIGIILFFYGENPILRMANSFGAFTLLVLYKRIAKRLSGVSWQSYLYWHFGLSFGDGFPPVEKKLFVGD